MDLQTLINVQSELTRFEKKLSEAIKAVKADSLAFYGSRATGAVKRAAMDLKNELHKITSK